MLKQDKKMTLRHISPVSRAHLAIFLIVFASIGYLIFRSLAAPNPNLPGDLNSDNTVNIQDLSILLSNYNTTNSTADINSDGTVNVLDLSILLSHYGQTYSGGGGTLGSKLPARMAESTGTKVLYASPTGSGTSCSLASPCSFNQAWSSAASGTIINLLGGNYSNYYVIQSKRYSVTSPVTMQSYAGQMATFTGCPSSCPQNVLYFGDDLGIRIRNITVTGPSNIGAGIKFEDDSYMEIDHVTTNHTNGNGILVAGTTNGFTQTYNDHIQILNSTISQAGYGQADNNQTHGLYMGAGTAESIKHGVDNFLIANNVFYDQPTGWELQLGDQASNGFVVNNTFHHAYSKYNSETGAGIVVWGAGPYADSNDVIANNLFTSESTYAIDPVGTTLGGISATYNMSYGNGSSPDYYSVNSLYSVSNNFANANPLYVDSASHDFHLQSGSPAIGKSDPAYTPAFDHDGKARSSAPTLGAYEF